MIYLHICMRTSDVSERGVNTGGEERTGADNSTCASLVRARKREGNVENRLNLGGL